MPRVVHLVGKETGGLLTMCRNPWGKLSGFFFFKFCSNECQSIFCLAVQCLSSIIHLLFVYFLCTWIMLPFLFFSYILLLMK